MKHLIFLILLSYFPGYIISQTMTPEALGFSAHRLSSEELGDVNYYLSADSSTVPKPLLVYLDGSGAYPLFQEIDDGGIGSTVVLDFDKLSQQFTILLISKPGIPFVDKMGFDQYGYPEYPEPLEYKEKLSLNWRVQSADQIINQLVKTKKVDPNRIVVLGFSEGAQVGPLLAATNHHITHLLLFGGNGLNQFFDPIITARMKAASGQLTEEEAQMEIDSLFIAYDKIYNDPNNTKENWWGHTYQRWSSFTESAPYKSLLDLDIPIYIANGSLDENSVLSADYIKLEFIRKRKTNLTYKTYVNYDHQFNELKFVEGEFKEATPRLDEVLDTAFDWLDGQD